MFYQNKIILVTGGTGFVGSHFVEELLRQGARVRIPIHERPPRVSTGDVETVPADLTRQEDCLRVCRGVDFVVHAAGAVGAAGSTASDLMSVITLNVNLTMQMLKAAWAEGARRFLLFSSSTGYPSASHPVKEEEFWSGPPHPSYLGYGWMRRYLERMGEFVHSRSHTEVAIARPTAVYGRHDNFDPRTGHVIPALIRRAVAGEDPFVVWGRADVVRDFLHITDFAKGCLLLLEKHAKGDPVNIGYGEDVTVGQIVQSILRAAGREDAQVQFDESKPTTIPFRAADTEKARKLLGFEPTVTLQEGLSDTVKWYKEAIGSNG